MDEDIKLNKVYGLKSCLEDPFEIHTVYAKPLELMTNEQDELWVAYAISYDKELLKAINKPDSSLSVTWFKQLYIEV